MLYRIYSILYIMYNVETGHLEGSADLSDRRRRRSISSMPAIATQHFKCFMGGELSTNDLYTKWELNLIKCCSWESCMNKVGSLVKLSVNTQGMDVSCDCTLTWKSSLSLD